MRPPSPQVIVNRDGLPASITAAAGGSVSVTTMYMTSVSSGPVTVVIQASTGGSVTASYSVTLGTSGPQLVTLPAGFSGVDAVTFTPQLGDGAEYGPADTQFAIDNLALTTTPPAISGGFNPTAAPSAPTAGPTEVPSTVPSATPTDAPATAAPTASPTASPTAAPATQSPTASPTTSPSAAPATQAPTAGPTAAPTPSAASPPPAAPPAPVAPQTCSAGGVVTFDTGLVDGTLSQAVNTLGGVAGAEGLRFPGFVPADGYDEVSGHVL